MKYLSIVFLCTAILFSCKKESSCDCFKSTGTVESEYRDVTEPFTRIEANDIVNVYITDDSIRSIRVEAGKHLIPLISTEISNGVLHLGNHNKCNWVRSFKIPINVYVSAPHLRDIISYGTGNLYSTNTLHADTLGIESWGSGHFELSLQTQVSFCTLHNGVGDAVFTGSSGINYIYSGGYGVADLRNFDTDTSVIDNRGTGDFYVNTMNQLSASIRSYGNVYYKGNPSTIWSDVTGEGKLLPL